MKTSKHINFDIILPLVILVLSTACKEVIRPAVEDNSVNLVEMVYPHLDTENSRWFYFASASRPFGMVNLSPDTEINGAWGSGYRYKTDTIKGFSHVHGWQISALSVMPVTLDQSNQKNIYDDFYSKFSHDSEVLYPGYHKVELDRYNIVAELTSSKRVGFHRYLFPQLQDSGILFNLNTILGPSQNRDGELHQTGPKELQGKVVAAPTIRRPKPLTVFFKIQLNTTIESVDLDEKTSNYLLRLGSSADTVLMKAGISYTSIENAALNIQEEIPHWNFETIVDQSKKEWNSLLGRIKIEGGTAKDQRRFYTDLWHALQGRRTISDVNGSYPDNTGETFKIGQIPLDAEGTPKFNHYNSDSFWGAQWTLNTLWGLVYPDIMEEFVHSLMQYYKDGGMVPRGPSGGNYTYVMTGASSTPFIVSAIQKGIVKDDLEDIYNALKKNHSMNGIMAKAGYEHITFKGGGLQYYLEKDFVPHPNPEGKFGAHQDGVSLTLEYAYQDFALAQLAKKIGYKDDYKYFIKRSQNYQNVFNKKSGWMQPKNVHGDWDTNFDPYLYENGFNESNGAQSTWFVPHDIPGLATLMGGNDSAAEKLNSQFVEAEKLGFTSGSSHAQELHPEYSRIPINYGNQPSMQTAYIFNLLGRPDLTQFWSRKVISKVFSGLSPATGYNGDEDQGLMGSLAVLMKIGLFQMNGGTEENPEYQIGGPIFDRITIELHPNYSSGSPLEIKAVNNSPENSFIENASYNGEQCNELSVRHEELSQGGQLLLQMKAKQH